MTFIELKTTGGEVWVENTDTNTTYGFVILGKAYGEYTLAPASTGRDNDPITTEQNDEAEAAKAFADTVVKRMHRERISKDWSKTRVDRPGCRAALRLFPH